MERRLLGDLGSWLGMTDLNAGVGAGGLMPWLLRGWGLVWSWLGGGAVDLWFRARDRARPKPGEAWVPVGVAAVAEEAGAWP